MDRSSFPKIQPKSKHKLSVPLFDSPPRSPPPRRSYGGGGSDGGEGRRIDYPSYQSPYLLPYQTPHQPPYQTSYQTPYGPSYQSGGYNYGGGGDGGKGRRIGSPSLNIQPKSKPKLKVGRSDPPPPSSPPRSHESFHGMLRGIDSPPSPSQPSYNPHRGYAYGDIPYGGGYGGNDDGSYGGKGRRIDSPPPPDLLLPPPPLFPPPPRSFNKEDIMVDPDSGSSSLCSGCRLPIFSTPSISILEGGEQLFLHDQCTRLPEILDHELHPHHTLALLNQPQNSTITCHNCEQICGTLLYHCVDRSCDFRLDLLCSSQIRIVHRSHHHSMHAIRQREPSSLTCGACDTKHESESETETETATISYLCNLCGFWIHPDCASLPNAILHYEEHEHSLFLTYNIIPSAADYSECVICEGIPKRSSGVYFCLKCPNYVVHIRCALTRPKSFKPVFIRDAQVADLGRLPMPDDHTSLIPYIRENTATTAIVDDHYQSKLHSHPLIFHKIDDGDPSISRVCNACVQSISSPPFFTCSHCPNFSLHSCCADLPTEIEHPIHTLSLSTNLHALSLSTNAPKSDISRSFYCLGCHLPCNGFAYSCKKCKGMSLDVICALITPTITHESHNKTHILFMSRKLDFSSDQICNCCNSVLNGICYECSICRNFKLHVRCALLPTTISHAFDKHPLQLTSNTAAAAAGANDDEEDEFCEVCEEHLEKRHWYYSCSECDQSFHVDCIPSVDRLSRIKLGSTVRVDGHDCSIALIRERDEACGGRRCGFCGEMFKFSNDGLVYECSDCYFGIHYGCAEKCLLKS